MKAILFLLLFQPSYIANDTVYIHLQGLSDSGWEALDTIQVVNSPAIQLRLKNMYRCGGKEQNPLSNLLWSLSDIFLLLIVIAVVSVGVLVDYSKKLQKGKSK